MSRKPIRQLALTLLLLLVGATSARAGVVTSAADDGSDGTLRTVIANAPSGDTITFDSGLNGQTITLTQGQLVIDKDLTISGPGANSLTISGGNAGRVLHIASSTVPPTVTLSGVTISDGAIIEAYPVFWGGGILNQGSLTLHNCTLANNSSWDGGNALQNDGALTVEGCTFAYNYQDTARGSIGGAIRNSSPSPVTINNSVFVGNSAYSAGAIFNEYTAGTIHITATTFADNTATYIGGGVYNEGGDVTIENSTFSGNTVTGAANGLSFAGALYNTNEATVNIVFCTFADNSASYGSAIYSSSGMVNLKNSLFANSGGQDCDGGNYSTSGVNITTRTVFLSNFVQVTAADLNLQPLADNGGPTPTHVLGPGSAALNAATDNTDFSGVPVTVDQRGVIRPSGGVADVGAVEILNHAPSVSAPASVTGVIDAPLSFTATATDPDDNPITFRLGNAPSGATIDSAGVVSWTPTSAGNYTIEVIATDSYGASDMATVSVSVTDPRAATTLSVENAAGRRGGRVTLSATLVQSGDGAISGKTVTFSVGGVPVGSGVTNRKGTVSVSYLIPANATPGTLPITASFAGDSAFRPASGSATLTIRR